MMSLLISQSNVEDLGGELFPLVDSVKIRLRTN